NRPAWDDLKLHRSAHQLRQLARDRQAETAARCLRPIAAVEALEDLRGLVERDPGALVFDGQQDSTVPARGAQPDRRARWCVYERVLHEDPADLQRPLLVPEGGRLGTAVDTEVVAARTGDGIEFLDERDRDRCEIDGLPLHP